VWPYMTSAMRAGFVSGFFDTARYSCSYSNVWRAGQTLAPDGGDSSTQVTDIAINKVVVCKNSVRSRKGGPGNVS